MSNLRRYPVLGRPCFITAVTHGRAPILVENIDLLRTAFRNVRYSDRIDAIAWVVLPDHLHVIIDLHDNDLSKTIQRIKMSFAAQLRKRLNMQSGTLWQKRFWDHIIRDQQDMNRHIDYMHYNPVKHRYTRSPFDWPHSLVHRYAENGTYAPDWGMIEKESDHGGFGE